MTAHVGEINHLRKARDRGRCHTCGDLERCTLLHGITPRQIQNVYAYLFARLPRAQMLIDNSKRLPWAARFLDDGTYRKRYVHLIRDPRALARRWSLFYADTVCGRMKQRWQVIRAFPQWARKLLIAPQPFIYACRWLAENQAITRFIAKHDLDAKVVSYEEVAQCPASAVQPLMEWMGLDYESRQLDYWTIEHHGTQKEAYDWVKDRKTPYFDIRWKSFLSRADSHLIATDPSFASYLAGFGFRMGDDGLVRTTETSTDGPASA